MNDDEIIWEDLIVKPYDWQIEDGQMSSENSQIRVWCLDHNNVPYLIRIMDFPYFCYLELPTYNSYGIEIIWDNYNTGKVYVHLCRVLESNAPFNFIFTAKTKLVPMQKKLAPLLRLCFRNKKNIIACQNKLGYPMYIKDIGRIKMSLLEADIKLIRRLLTDRKCGYCQWFKISGRLVDDTERISTVKKEYIVKWPTLEPLDDMTVTSPIILSYDAEVYSHNPRAFPNALNILDECYMISCIYQRAGKRDTRKKIVILCGAYTGQMADTEIIKVQNELAVIFKFADMVK